MEHIEVSGDETVPLDDVAPGVSGLRLLFVNIFAVQRATGWTLIDAGLTGSAGIIRKWAQEHMGGDPPEAIVLTHAHFDHVGALEALLDEWHAPVYVHREEWPYVTGARAYPPPDPSVGGGMMARMSTLYPRGPIALKDEPRELPDDGSIPSLPDWRWIHTPGHSAGHVSLFRDADRTLIIGDAFCRSRSSPWPANVRNFMARPRTSRRIGTRLAIPCAGSPRCGLRSSRPATDNRWLGGKPPRRSTNLVNVSTRWPGQPMAPTSTILAGRSLRSARAEEGGGREVMR
jgi:glyoxylase-like metal-dependent hydrolase (beta-lactamase superfamily II)